MQDEIMVKIDFKRSGFLWGAAAVILWGLLAALSRSILEMLGTFTAGGCIYMAGGLVCFILYPPKKRKFSWRYHGCCGALAILYFIFYSIGLGLAVNRIQAVEMSLINYLWPILTLLFSVIMFRKKTNIFLMILGMATAFYGLALSTSVLSGIELSPQGLWNNFCCNPLPYLLMTGAAVCWAFYSNILNTVGKETPIDALPWFFFIGGLILFLCRYPFHEVSHWSFSALWQIIVMALLPTGAGYYCWDKAMQAENPSSSMIFSYMTPLFSAIFCAIFLKLNLPWTFYGACLLVIAGALLSRYAIRPSAKK